ncbi:MAG: SET domain-containing protein [Pseudomonadota bacterium]
MPKRKTGFQFDYRVEKAGDKGLGIFANEPIPSGAVVWRHVPGTFEVLDEVAFRAKIAKMPAAGVVYELTHVHGFEEFPECIVRALDDGILINHSSQPNLATQKTAVAPVTLDWQSDDYLGRVSDALGDDRYSLVATRDIETGEELANDYNRDDGCPPFYDALCEHYGVQEDYLEQDENLDD